MIDDIDYTEPSQRFADDIEYHMKTNGHAAFTIYTSTHRTDSPPPKPHNENTPWKRERFSTTTGGYIWFVYWLVTVK